MWLSRMFSVVTGKRRPCPHAELLQRADEFEMEGEADPAKVARAIQIMQGGNGYLSMVYDTRLQMSRHAARILIGSPWPSLMEAVVVRAASNWIRRQARRFQ